MERCTGWEEVENCIKKYLLFYFFKDTSSSLFPDISIRIKNCIWGTALAVHWLSLHFQCRGMGLILVGEKINKIAYSQALWGKKKLYLECFTDVGILKPNTIGLRVAKQPVQPISKGFKVEPVPRDKRKHPGLCLKLWAGRTDSPCAGSSWKFSSSGFLCLNTHFNFTVSILIICLHGIPFLVFRNN